MLIRLASVACAAGIVTSLLAAAPIQSIAVEKSASVAPVAKTAAAPKAAALPQAAPASVSGAVLGEAIPEPVVPTTGGGLKPRVALGKPRSSQIQLPVDPISGRPQWNGKLAVKFRDDLKVRADLIPSDFVRGKDGQPIQVVSDLLKGFNGSVRQLLRRSPEELRALEQRAERLSGTAQPDLAGMVYIDVQPDRLLDAARAFNNLDVVEFVEIERNPVLDGSGSNMSEQYGCGVDGPGATTGVTNCYTASPDKRCSTLGGGQGCNNVQGCTDPAGAHPNCRFGCNNTQCCETIGAILPGCTDMNSNRGWDALCASYANFLCTSTVYDSVPAVQGNQNTVPQSYKYDPCFAMRGAVDYANEQDVLVYGQSETPTPATTVPSQLLTYTVDSATGAFDSGSLVPVVYPNNQPSDEANPTTDVPQQALADPSLEGAYLAISAGCFSEHSFGGCNQVTCCVYVCRADPSCCVIEWDKTCVTLADSSQTGTLLGKPCTSQLLPIANFPPSGTTPQLTAGASDLVGPTRGYQDYLVGKPILGAFDPLPAGQTYPVVVPTVYSSVQAEPLRNDLSSNVGTMAILNTGYRGGGLDLSAGGEYERINAQLGINSVTKTRGQGVHVAVIEFSAYVNHEDLKNQVTGEANQTQVLIVSDPLNPNHGTAVLGIIGAERNDIGVTGIAYGAKLNFYPTVSVQEGSRLPNALTNAIIDLNEGDVINMSIGFGSGLTILTSPVVFTLVTVATSADITTVVSAGNDALPVVTSPPNNGGGTDTSPTDAGAIVVGACWPGYPVGQLSTTFSNPTSPVPGYNYCRLNFSNFTDLENGKGRVDVAAWGTGVTSTGYGDLFLGTNSSVDPLQVDRLRSYTAQFNGTSAAAPIISGWCACLQSFSKTWFGAPLPVGVLRNAVSLNVYQQCGISYASRNFPGYPETGSPAVGDIVAGGKQARIGGFPRTGTTLSWIVANTFGGTPVGFDVIAGKLESGTTLSIRQLDGSNLRIGSKNYRAGTKGQGYGTVLYYPISGQTTDLQLHVTTPHPPTSVTGMGLATSSAVSWNTPVIEVVYFYNINQKRWVAAGSTFLTGTQAQVTFQPIGALNNYTITSPSGGTVCYARVYTCGFGTSGYNVLHDLLDLNMAINIFDAGGGMGQ